MPPQRAPSRLLWVTAAMQTTEVPSAEQGDQQHAGAQGGYFGRIFQCKITDTAHQNIADDAIEKAPKHVDRRRGQTLSGRFGKWTLERSPHGPADQMRNCVAQKETTKEIRQQRQPIHFTHSLPTESR